MKASEPRWLDRLVVEAMHVDQVREHGGLIGLRDENALESDRRSRFEVVDDYMLYIHFISHDT